MALERRAIEGGSWLVRISLAQTGKWLVDLGQVAEPDLVDVSPEFLQDEILHWTTESATPMGRLTHLSPVLNMSETQPYWSRPSVPLGFNDPVWPN